jgi:hypothetical protein
MHSLSSVAEALQTAHSTAIYAYASKHNLVVLSVVLLKDGITQIDFQAAASTGVTAPSRKQARTTGVHHLPANLPIHLRAARVHVYVPFKD